MRVLFLLPAGVLVWLGCHVVSSCLGLVVMSLHRCPRVGVPCLFHHPGHTLALWLLVVLVSALCSRILNFVVVLFHALQPFLLDSACPSLLRSAHVTQVTDGAQDESAKSR